MRTAPRSRIRRQGKDPSAIARLTVAGCTRRRAAASATVTYARSCGFVLTRRSVTPRTGTVRDTSQHVRPDVAAESRLATCQAARGETSGAGEIIRAGVSNGIGTDVDTTDRDVAEWLPDEPGEFNDPPARAITAEELGDVFLSAEDVEPEEHQRLLAECERFSDVLDKQVRAVVLREANEHRVALGLPRRPVPTRAATPQVNARRPATRGASRSREHRQTRRRAAARSPGREDADPEPLPALAGRYTLTCASCGEPFHANRPHARTCSHRCRQRLYATPGPVDERLVQLGDLARSLVRAGELTPEDALVLVICPTPAILAALADREAVAA